MVLKAPEISPGLYLVATPIGTASDISLRALDLLAKADILVAEDTRNLRKLMNIHQIKLKNRILISYHDHNGAEQRPKIIKLIKNQNSVVLVSDAGTPLIADPGYQLVRDVISEGLAISSVPGASAVLSALMVSGLPTDKFFFAGFIPPKKGAKETFFSDWLNLPSSLVFYESSTRLIKTLNFLSNVCDENRQIAVCRELTKKFEEVQRGTVKSVLEHFSKREKIKGEIVLVVGPPKAKTYDNDEIDNRLMKLFKNMTIKDAVNLVSEELKLSRKIVYSRALEIKMLVDI